MMVELWWVDLGEGQGFCMLVEVLDGFLEMWFNIDIKLSVVVDLAA